MHIRLRRRKASKNNYNSVGTKRHEKKSFTKQIIVTIKHKVLTKKKYKRVSIEDQETLAEIRDIGKDIKTTRRAE